VDTTFRPDYDTFGQYDVKVVGDWVYLAGKQAVATANSNVRGLTRVNRITGAIDLNFSVLQRNGSFQDSVNWIEPFGDFLLVPNWSITNLKTQSGRTSSLYLIDPTNQIVRNELILDPAKETNYIVRYVNGMVYYGGRASGGQGTPGNFFNGFEATCTGPNAVLQGPDCFTTQQFVDLLGRQPDQAALDFYSAQLQSRAQTRSKLVESFASSPELDADVGTTARLYLAYYLREPDEPGLQFWVGEKRKGLSLVDLSNRFATAPEFVSRYGNVTNRQFIELVYSNVLGRAGEAAGVNFWTAELDKGVSRGEMMVQFSESPEFKAKSGGFIKLNTLVPLMMRRSVQKTEVDFWVPRLNSGQSTTTDLAEAIIKSQEYANRFIR
jgi:hypothetical protein